jgi:hypothetical protein
MKSLNITLLYNEHFRYLAKKTRPDLHLRTHDIDTARRSNIEHRIQLNRPMLYAYLGKSLANN